MAAISGQRTSRSTSGSWKPTLSGRVGLGLLDLVRLDDVALLEVLVAVSPEAALESDSDFLDVVLEALEAADLPFVDLLVVPQQLRQRATGNPAILNPRTGNDADFRDLDRGQHFGATLPNLDEGRLVKALDGALDVVGDVVDDVITTDVDLLPLRGALGRRFGPDVEGDHQRI